MLHTYHWVGILEDLEGSLKLLKRTFPGFFTKFDPFAQEAGSWRRNIGSRGGTPVGNSTTAFLKLSLVPDMELYELAKARLVCQLSAIGWQSPLAGLEGRVNCRDGTTEER